MNNEVGLKIKSLREQKGISQDAMAMELDITQPNYGRLEKGDARLTVPKLKIIAKVLEVPISKLFGEKIAKIINQQNSQNTNAYVENIINADKEHIQTLKEEIIFLRELTKKK